MHSSTFHGGECRLASVAVALALAAVPSAAAHAQTRFVDDAQRRVQLPPRITASSRRARRPRAVFQ